MTTSGAEGVCCVRKQHALVYLHGSSHSMASTWLCLLNSQLYQPELYAGKAQRALTTRSFIYSGWLVSSIQAGSHHDVEPAPPLHAARMQAGLQRPPFAAPTAKW